MRALENFEPDPEFRITVDVSDFERRGIPGKDAVEEIVVIKTLPSGEQIGYAYGFAKGSEITEEHALMASFALTKRWRDMRNAAAAKQEPKQ